MKKKTFAVEISLVCALLLMGCSIAGAGTSKKSDTEQAEAIQYTIADADELIGKADSDIADVFGGGEENWTSDKSTYIGRMYQTELYGESVTIHAVCGGEKTVDAVSIWITDGGQEVADELVQTWQDRVTAFTGTEMQDQGIAEESGAKSWKWPASDRFYTLRLMGNILTLDINPAVGEIK